VYTEDVVMSNMFKDCFIMKTLLNNYSKAAYCEFSDIFKFFENIMKDVLPENLGQELWQSLCGVHKTCPVYIGVIYVTDAPALNSSLSSWRK
jgi:hypothetical protein